MDFPESIVIKCPVDDCKGNIQLDKRTALIATGEYSGKCTLHKKVVFVRLEYMIL